MSHCTNIPIPCATAANAPEIASVTAVVATVNNKSTLDPMMAAIANGIAAHTQNLNNLATAVNATNANVNHLTTMINQGSAANGGGGGAGGRGSGEGSGGGVGGGPVPLALSLGCTKTI